MPANARPSTKPTRPAPNVIDRQRQTYVAMIGQARALGSESALLDKAQSLLTAHWGNSDWDARAAILKTVDWLLRVAMHNPASALKGRNRPVMPATAGSRRDAARPL